MELLPHAFLFRFAVPIPHVAGRPKRGRWPVGDDVTPLPLFSALDRSAGDPTPPDVVLRAAWNESGLGISATINGKSNAPYAHAESLAAGDGLHVWIDTRNAQGVHRANRYCHRFMLLPAVGRGKSAKPALVSVDIPRAKETAPLTDLSIIPFATEVIATGYRVEAWFPTQALNGFDPEHSPRIGFHAVLVDAERGEIPLTVGHEFPTDHDPSLWTTLDLMRDSVS